MEMSITDPLKGCTCKGSKLYESALKLSNELNSIGYLCPMGINRSPDDKHRFSEALAEALIDFAMQVKKAKRKKKKRKR